MAVGRLGDLHGLGHAGGERLLDQDVLAGSQRLHGQARWWVDTGVAMTTASTSEDKSSP